MKTIDYIIFVFAGLCVAVTIYNLIKHRFFSPKCNGRCCGDCRACKYSSEEKKDKK